MLRSHLLRGASACAITLARLAVAQARRRCRPSTSPRRSPAEAIRRAGDEACGSGGRHTGYKPTGPNSSSKTDMPILKTPYSVQVVTRQTMDDRQVVNLQDAVFTNVSGVSARRAILRHFHHSRLRHGGRFYRNGLRHPYTTDLETGNLQSIEVLKGPAAMLLGVSSPAASINFVPKRPQATPYYSMQEQAGNFGTYAHDRSTPRAR